MAYRPTYKKETDAEIKDLIVNAGHATVADLSGKGLREGTVRNSLKRLFEAGAVQRTWNGSERFGHYVYSASPEVVNS